MKMVLQKTRIVNDQIVVGNLTVLILSLLIVISEAPIIARNIPNTIFYGLVMVFFVSTINFIFNLEKNRSKTVLWLVLYLFMISIYKVLAISSADLSYYSTTVKFFFFLVAMLIIAGHMTRKQKIFIVSTIIVSVLFTIFDNIRLYMQYGASVYVHLFQWERFTTNSVNTTFVSSLLFLSGIVFVVFLHTKRRMLKLGTIALIFLNLLFIAMIAQRMIILGLAMVMLPLLVLYNQKHCANRVIIVGLFCFLIILLLINFTTVIDFVDKLIGSGRLHLRFEQLKLLFRIGRVGDVGGTLTARFNLYLRSINTWFSSFSKVLFGAGDHRITNEIIGNHSDYIDDCARYGIVGMFVWIPLTVSFMSRIGFCVGVRKKSPLMRQMKVILLIFSTNALLSGVYEATVGIQIFILLPIVFSLIQENEEKKCSIGSV